MVIMIKLFSPFLFLNSVFSIFSILKMSSSLFGCLRNHCQSCLKLLLQGRKGFHVKRTNLMKYGFMWRKRTFVQWKCRITQYNNVLPEEKKKGKQKENNSLVTLTLTGLHYYIFLHVYVNFKGIHASSTPWTFSGHTGDTCLAIFKIHKAM